MPTSILTPFFHAVVRFAARAKEVMAELELSEDVGRSNHQYFANVARINLILAEMAELQRSGEPHGAEHMAFIYRAVTSRVNRDGTVLGHAGWYSELHFDPLEAVKGDPVITDVHTDIGGAMPKVRDPSVLHIATGYPRLIVLTVESCGGPRAYPGSYSLIIRSWKRG